MSDITKASLAKVIQGNAAVRERAASLLANGTPEQSFIAGMGLVVSAGNAGFMVPLAMTRNICDAIEAAVYAQAAELGIDL